MMELINIYRRRYYLPVAHSLIIRRPDDKYLVSFPRSGSTWLRTILVNIIEPNANSDPDVFNRVIPGVSIRRTLRINANPSPRIIHSHTWFRPDIPYAIYIVRDGRDSLVSFYHYLITRRGKSRELDFPSWFEHYCHGHYGQRWDENVISWLDKGRAILGDKLKVINFEHLKSDCESVVGEVATWLGLPCEAARIRSAITAASLENARKIEMRCSGGKLSADRSFYRGGETGQWQKFITNDLYTRFYELSGRAMRLAGYDD